jgi:erythritol kinase
MHHGAAVALPSDLLIGLDVGPSSIEAAAFALDGQELARAAAAVTSQGALAGGCVEQDVGEIWRAAAAALRQLGQVVPHLAARTAALAITGGAGGAWLIDDDGDPVAPALLPHDQRAESLIARWRQDGTAREIRQITGSPLDPSRQSATLAWLAAHRSEMLDRAASAFTAKDCVYFFCTGERATDAAAAAGAFGDWRTGAYDARVLELLGLQSITPSAAGDRRRHQAPWRADDGRSRCNRPDRWHAGSAGAHRYDCRRSGARPRRARSGHRRHHARRDQLPHARLR